MTKYQQKVQSSATHASREESEPIKRKKILFVKPWNGSGFIEQDGGIIKKHFVVYEVLPLPLKRLLGIFIAILNRKVDAVFIWFVFWWACPIVLISRLTRVKVVLVPSGVDVANYPEIRYGELRNLRSRIMTKFALNNADLVLPVSDFIRQEVLKVSKPRKMKVIYNGVDVHKFRCIINNKLKENIVLTVGGINLMNLKYKRLDLFVDCARYLPEVNFIIIGPHLDGTVTFLKQGSPVNVFFTGFLPEDDLICFYSRAKVYAQLSHAEAFGCALAEAMACECIPVVVNRGALPEIVGGTGFYAPYNDPQATAQIIRNALNSDKKHKTRERISRMFALEKREMELVQALNEILSSQ